MNADDWISVFRHIPSNDVLIAPDQRVIDATDGYLEMALQTREALIGKRLFDMFPRVQGACERTIQPQLVALCDKAAETRETQEAKEFQFDLFDNVTQQEVVRYWNIKVTPILAADGSVRALLYHAQDITELFKQRLDFTATLNSTKVFKLLVDNITDYAIYMMDIAGNIRTWNVGAKRMKQYEADEIIGKHCSKFYTKEALTEGRPYRDLELARVRGRWEDETWHVRKDGTAFWANVVITSIHNEEKGLVGFAKITRDLTERLLLEKKTIASFEEAARLKSEFLANMSHEIRTPMNGVVSAATLLVDTTLNDDQSELVSMITDSGQTLVRVINDILDYSKMESNEFKLHPEPFSIHNEIMKVCKNYNMISGEGGKSVSVKFQSEGDIPTVFGDAFRFQQILRNLVDNALKFTERGSVTVRAQYETPEVGRVLAKIQVSDTGIGMSRDDLIRLFLPFSQLDTSARKKYKGTGLGLSICKNLVELMDGKISVESNLGVGSTFTFSVSFAQDDSSMAAKKEDRKPPERTSKIFPAKIAGKGHPTRKVLVAEDNTINQKVIMRVLEKLGYRNVDLAVDGTEAVKKFQEGHYDLILMDIQMPVKDGLSATKEIREFSQTIPIIAMTANALKGDDKICLAAGMNDYLTKPIDFIALGRVLDRWLLPVSVWKCISDPGLSDKETSETSTTAYSRTKQVSSSTSTLASAPPSAAASTTASAAASAAALTLSTSAAPSLTPIRSSERTPDSPENAIKTIEKKLDRL